MTASASSTTVTEAQFNGNGQAFTTSYAERINIANLSGGCAGIAALRDNYKGYTGYICSNGSWLLIRYDATGSPSTVDQGSYTANGNSDLIEMSTNGSTVDFHVDAVLVSSDPITNGYMTTSVLGLSLYHFNGGDAQATFSNYVYSPQ